jgi:uncharacterized protein
MREHEPGASPFGPPRGEPDRPLVEAGILFAAFYLTAYLPLGPAFTAASIASPAYHAAMAAINAPRALLALYIMATTDGLAAFGLGKLRRSDPLKALLAALGAFAAIVPAALLFSALGITNPLMAGLGQGSRGSYSLVPFFLASSLATGYAEELFFRSYLMRRLGRSGLPPLWAAVASSLLFGAAHGTQGIVGVASTTLVGLWFAWRWQHGRNIHEIAIGHGLYDAAVFALALYA